MYHFLMSSKKAPNRSIMIHLLFIFFCHCAFAFNYEAVNKTAFEKGVPQEHIDTLLNYARKFEDKIKNLKYVTFVDFRKPSNEKRGLLIQTETGSVYTFLVAHGKNSGGLYARFFSNVIDSNMSSLGLYYVENEYYGDNGSSLKLSGLSPSNSNVKARHIVIHPAEYVSEKMILETGSIGPSLGCFALDKPVAKLIQPLMKNGSLMLAFH